MVYFVVSAYVDNMLVEIQHCDTGFNFKVDSLLYNTYFIIGNTSNTDIMKVSGEEFIRLHNSHKVLGVRYNKGENIYNIFYLTFWKAILLCNIKYIGTSFTRLEAFNGKYHDDYFMDCILKLSGNSDFYIKALDPSRQSYIYLHIVNLLMSTKGLNFRENGFDFAMTCYTNDLCKIMKFESLDTKICNTALGHIMLEV